MQLTTTCHHILLLTLLGSTMVSCVPHHELINFQEGEEFPLNQEQLIENLPQQTIQPDDRISIRVSTFDEEAAEPFNQRFVNFGNNNNNAGNNNNSINQQLFGYLVDERGIVDFPVLGSIELGGLSLEQAKDKLYRLLGPYLEDPVVDIRFLNRKFTIFGEVGAPGTIPMDRNRLNVLDAIQRAGGLTQFSNRSNILVIREQDGKRVYGRLNVKQKDVFESPYYYLYNNDVVYVEPIRAKTATVQSPFFRYLSYVGGLLSTASIIIALTR